MGDHFLYSCDNNIWFREEIIIIIIIIIIIRKNQMLVTHGGQKFKISTSLITSYH